MMGTYWLGIIHDYVKSVFLGKKKAVCWVHISYDNPRSFRRDLDPQGRE